MTASMQLNPRLRTLTDAEYVALAGYLAREAGLVFDESRRAALAGIVGDRLAATGAADLGAYLARISAPEGAAERQQSARRRHDPRRPTSSGTRRRWRRCAAGCCPS